MVDPLSQIYFDYLLGSGLIPALYIRCNTETNKNREQSNTFVSLCKSFDKTYFVGFLQYCYFLYFVFYMFSFLVKFMFSKKATKINKIFTLEFEGM